ncbi:GTP-dependent dephospho-CoA kinase family protein [Natrinema sp. DC36]|uniref:GTP-dependent dephospho-CoA kinase family protein n=1 Tax=Natrinema sp. DC36 TaxID=2878680 RepID=UPI001CF039B7|nr:GTP-dependent dephospho-CoA kinase family protein [Natrinema sp. DC36]
MNTVETSYLPPLIAVGDVVSYRLLEAGHRPDIALVDGRIKRSAADEGIREAVTEGSSIEVRNPPAELAAPAVRTLRRAFTVNEPTTILVDGEGDLVALPAIVAASSGESVVYGRSDEGMIHVKVTDDHRTEMRDLLERFEGNTERFWEILEGGS